MKRPTVLIGILILLLLAWGGWQIQTQRQRAWLEAASQSDLEAYVKAHPRDGDALVRLGTLLRDDGDIDRSVTVLRQAMEADPSEQTIAALARSLPDSEEANSLLSRFLNQNPDSVLILAVLSHRFQLMGDPGNAQQTVDRALALDSGSADAWQSKGELMLSQQRLPDAEKAFRKVLSKRDDNEIRLALVRVLIPAQRFTEVKELCAPLLQPDRRPAVTNRQRARALLYTAGGRLYDPLAPAELATLQQQLQEVESLSEKLDPEERFLAPYFLGESQLRTGQPKEAIASLERSVALNPAFSGSLFSLARAYRMSGDEAKADAMTAKHQQVSRLMNAIQMYSDRLAERPDDPDATLRLAETFAEAGNNQQASHLYQKLITEGKNPKVVEVARRRLEQLSKGH